MCTECRYGWSQARSGIVWWGGLPVALDAEVISRSEAVAAVEAVEKALQALRGAAGQNKDRRRA